VHSIHKQTKTKGSGGKLDDRLTHPLIMVLTTFGTCVFRKSEFQDDQSINVGVVGGRNLHSSIDKAHRLYNSLLLLHKL